MSASLKNQKSGFTLIELLVVIAVIGILASIIVASQNSARRKSRDARRLADIKQTQIALELYFDANSGVYPADIYGASGLSASNACVTQPCMPASPADPLNGSNYTYAQSSSASYVLRAQLEEAGNPAFDSDADGAISGVDCADENRYYCVESQ